MRYLLVCILLLSACGKNGEKLVACEVVEMGIPYSFDGVSETKSDLHKCVFATGAHGKTCYIIRATNNASLYAQSNDMPCD
jgi:hypothetical protein